MQIFFKIIIISYSFWFKSLHKLQENKKKQKQTFFIDMKLY